MSTREPADQGITIIEVVVSMTIMTIFMALFGGAMMEIYRSFNTSEATAAAQGTTGVLFGRLEREIRYADSIGDPETIGYDHYVEYRTLDDAGASRCVSLRYNPTSRLLQRNTWPATGTMSAASWNTLASDVSLVGSAPPFAIPASASTNRMRQLTVKVRITSGTAGTARTTDFEVTFTALNSISAATTATNACSTARRAA